MYLTTALALTSLPFILGAAIVPRQDDSTSSAAEAISSAATAVGSGAAAQSSRATAATATVTGSRAATPSHSRIAISSVSRAGTLTGSYASAAGTGFPITSSSRPSDPCAIPDSVLEQYDYRNVQIALRYGPAPARSSSPSTGASSSSGWASLSGDVGNFAVTSALSAEPLSASSRAVAAGTMTRSRAPAITSSSRSLPGAASSTVSRPTSSASASPTRVPKLDNTLQCLHAGGTGEISTGLYGGAAVRLVPCHEAYRWSIRKDGRGVVVKNGMNPLWSLNAEDTVEGANVTIRETDFSSPNQTFSLTEDGNLRLETKDEDDSFCIEADDDGVRLARCSEDERDEEQTFVILLLPRPLSVPTPRSSASRTSTTQSFATLDARQVEATAIAGTATAVATATGATPITSRVMASSSTVSRPPVPSRSAASSVVSSRSSEWSVPTGCPVDPYDN